MGIKDDVLGCVSEHFDNGECPCFKCGIITTRDGYRYPLGEGDYLCLDCEDACALDLKFKHILKF